MLKISSMSLISLAGLQDFTDGVRANTGVVSEITLPQGGARGLGVGTNSDGKTIFMTSHNDGSGYYIDNSGSVINSFSDIDYHDAAALSHDAAYSGGFGGLAKYPFAEGKTKTERDMPARVYALTVSDTEDVLWAGGKNGRVWRMDPVTLDITNSIDFGGSVFGLAWDGTYLWVGEADTGHIQQYDPSSDETVATYNYPNAQSIYDYAFTEGHLWLEGDGRLYETDIDQSLPNKSPSASFTVSSTNPEVGSTVRFDASDSVDPDGEIASYEWDFTGDGSTDDSGQTASHSYTSAGEYDILLTVTDFEGATDTATVTVSVTESNELPQASFTVSPDELEVDTPVSFDASNSVDSDGDILSYDWDFTGDGSTDATGVEASTTYSEPGEHDVKLRVSDSEGATDETTQTVAVYASPEAEITVAPSNPDVGQEITFSAAASTDTDGSLETYKWNLMGDDGIDARGPEVTKKYQSSGEFQITLTVVDSDGLTAQDRTSLRIQAVETTEPEDSEGGESNNTENGETTSGEDGPGFGFSAGVAGIGSMTYLYRRHLDDDKDSE